MEIEQFDKEDSGFFKATENGEEAGRMTYLWKGDDRIIINHTEVGKAFSGKGVGARMVEEAVEFAREKNIRIVPLCPFAKAQFDRNPEWNDVR